MRPRCRSAGQSRHTAVRARCVVMTTMKSLGPCHRRARAAVASLMTMGTLHPRDQPAKKDSRQGLGARGSSDASQLGTPRVFRRDGRAHVQLGLGLSCIATPERITSNVAIPPLSISLSLSLHTDDHPDSACVEPPG
jgi:hypothetical protein